LRRLLAVLLLWGCGGDAQPGEATAQAQRAPAAQALSTPATTITAAGDVVLPIPTDGVRLNSGYSKIHIVERRGIRSLYFIRDSGEYALETAIDMAHPEHLQSKYTQAMFASYLFRPHQDSALLIGLGGGAMVRFMQRFTPQVRLDVVEIDPVVVQAAEDYFGAHPVAPVRFITEDAFVYFRDSTEKYDVIYMDAFLKPSDETDATGYPLRFRTVEFLRQVGSHLTPGGVVVFNLNAHDGLDEDFSAIDEAFEQVYILHPSQTGNYVVVATTSPDRLSKEAIERVGHEVDETLKADFSIADLSRWLQP